MNPFKFIRDCFKSTGIVLNSFKLVRNCIKTTHKFYAHLVQTGNSLTDCLAVAFLCFDAASDISAIRFYNITKACQYNRTILKNLDNLPRCLSIGRNCVQDSFNRLFIIFRLFGNNSQHFIHRFLLYRLSLNKIARDIQKFAGVFMRKLDMAG